MSAKPALDELFERRITYPDFDPQERSPGSSATNRASPKS
jgi:hypothetical protein